MGPEETLRLLSTAAEAASPYGERASELLRQLAGVLIERRATRLVRDAVAIFTNAGGYQPREVRANR